MNTRFRVGYGIAATGYMVAIFLLSASPAEPSRAGAAWSVLERVLPFPLFAGLASCLLLSVADGRWDRALPGRLYVLIAGLTGAYAGFDEWYQSLRLGRSVSLTDVGLNLVGIGVLLLVHRWTTTHGAHS